MMEKRKLLLVAVSVGIFLVIVISASILVFTPRSPGGEAQASAPAANAGTVISTPRPIPAAGGSPQPEAPGRTQPASADVVDMVRSANGIPGLQPPPPSAVGQAADFYISADTPADRGEGNSQISVPAPRAAAVPNTPRQAAPTPRQAAPASRPAASAPAKAPAPAAKPAAVAEAKPATAKPAPAQPAAVTAKPAAVPAQPAATVKPAPARASNDYWIQIGAFSAKVRAEGVKETLAEKGITTIIDDGNVNGKTLYRVRVGPYTSEVEAGYWLALVKEMDGFSDSQIRSTVRK